MIITPSVVMAMRPGIAPKMASVTSSRWRKMIKMHRDTALAIALAARLAELTGQSIEDVLTEMAEKANG
jgi:hypothetical protein